MNGRELYEALNEVEDRYLDIVDALEREKTEMKSEKKQVYTRKAITVLIAAALCVSILAVTAIAAGWVPGIFQTLQEKYSADEELFDAAAQANTKITPEFAEIPQLDSSTFVLLEKYYDGETILLGYNMDLVLPEPVVGIQPDKTLLRKIKKGIELSRVGWSKSKDWQAEPVTKNAKKYHLGQDAFVMEQMMKSTLTEEAYDRAWNLLETQGWVCLATQDVYIGDHIFINGQDYYDPETNPDGLIVEYETEYGDCLRIESLPAEARNQDSVTVTLKLKNSVQYWYMDLEGNGWIYHGEQEPAEISFELKREEVQ